MTSQQIFDIVIDHLLTQGKPSRSDVCLYRSSDGSKCAVGVLIPDSEYDSNMEFSVVDAECQIHPTPIQAWAQWKYPHDLKLLSRLQKLHDDGPDPINGHPPEAWKEYILTQSEIIATEFNLTWRKAS